MVRKKTLKKEKEKQEISKSYKKTCANTMECNSNVRYKSGMLKFSCSRKSLKKRNVVELF